jgi:hypothetical protein
MYLSLWSACFKYALALINATLHPKFSLALAIARLAYISHILMQIFISLAYTFAVVLPMAHMA